MSVIEKLRRLVEPPAIEITTYQCVDCGATFEAPDESCPDCGGRIKETEDADRVLAYQHLGPYQ